MDQTKNDNNSKPEADKKHTISTWVGTLVILIIAVVVYIAFAIHVRNNPDSFPQVYLMNPQAVRDAQMAQNKKMMTPPAPEPPVYTSKNGISIIKPQPNDTVTSPLSILGYGLPAFESVPGFVQILDASGKVLTQKQLSVTDLGPGKVNGFLGSIDFSAKAGANITLRIHNDNPSGLNENTRILDIPLKVGK